MHKDLPVQSLFKGCRLTSDGTIKYFNATDWDHYEDGSEVTNGIEDGNDMVELPDAYYTVVVHGDYDWEIRMSLYPLEGYTNTTSKYDTFIIREPKERLIFKLPYYPDRIVHHAIMNILEPIWRSVFITNTYSEYRQQVCSHIGWMEHCNGINLLKKIIKYHQLIEYARSS